MLKLLHVVTQGCWVRIQTKIFEILSVLHIVYQMVLIPNLDIDFWYFEPKINFWANLGQKIQSCLFCLKSGAHSISTMLIPNPDLKFRNSNPKIHLWANLGAKNGSCTFCLKIGAHISSRMLIPNLDLDFRNTEPKVHCWENLGQKNQNCLLDVKIGCWFLKVNDFESRLTFLKSRPQNPILDKFGEKSSKLFPFV